VALIPPRARSWMSESERVLREAGHVCVRCGEPLGLYYEVLTGEGLVHPGQCPPPLWVDPDEWVRDSATQETDG
jgi:hypothetical protein